jgi:F0F1-type ATP synthase assembly protein I
MDSKDETPKEKNLKADLVTFAYELGTWIVVPLIVFLGIGIYVDKHFGTKPVGMIVALLVSLISTSVSIARKVKKFNP